MNVSRKKALKRAGLACYGRCVRGVADGFATHAEIDELRALTPEPSRGAADVGAASAIDHWRWAAPAAPPLGTLVRRAQTVLDERFGVRYPLLPLNIITWDGETGGVAEAAPARGSRACCTATRTRTRCSSIRRSSPLAARRGRRRRRDRHRRRGVVGDRRGDGGLRVSRRSGGCSCSRRASRTCTRCSSWCEGGASRSRCGSRARMEPGWADGQRAPGTLSAATAAPTAGPPTRGAPEAATKIDAPPWPWRCRGQTRKRV